MLPKVVIIGRPNVGKSSLLNLLAKRRISIVDPSAGVTRDRICATIEIGRSEAGVPLHAELIDTGGYGLDPDRSGEDLTPQIEGQISRGLAEADLVLFVVDAQAGLTPLDQTVGRLVRSQGSAKPVLLIANKVDGERWIAHGCEAARLGFGQPIMVSATTAYHKEALCERIRDHLVEVVPDADRQTSAGPEPGVLLAIVGKRNAGKSTLVNALAGDNRVIVSEHEGTTRDSVDVLFKRSNQYFTAIDTAGVRKRKSIKTDVEFYSLHRSLRSIRRADVCLLLIDVAVPVAQVDRHLAQEILKHHRPTIIVVNKWDLADGAHTQDGYGTYLDQELKVLSFAPIVFISAKNQDGLHDLLAMALNLHQQASHRVSTSDLNQSIERIMAERGPSAKGGKRAKIYYATQLNVCPPTIALFVNQPEIFDGNYQRFLINRFRDSLPYSEVPIRLLIRGKNRLPRQ